MHPPLFIFLGPGELPIDRPDPGIYYCGESSDVNSENIKEWVAKLPSIIQGYGPENIPEIVTRCFEKAGYFTGEVTASVENENDQQTKLHE